MSLIECQVSPQERQDSQTTFLQDEYRIRFGVLR